MSATKQQTVALVGGPLCGAGVVVNSARVHQYRVMVGQCCHTYVRGPTRSDGRAQFWHARVR